MRWDVFCRVIDNHGDLGVAWRLASDLAARGESVRLFVDDASALAWMAPAPRAVAVHGFDEATTLGRPGDVVVETFGCDLPDDFLAAMAARSPAPAWFDLEYLSAEPYVERSHGLPSPLHHGPGAGLVKRYWFPGFTERTGGLLRERGLVERLDRVDRHAWLAARGWAPAGGERVVVLFCYEQPRLAALLDRLAEAPTLLLATPGHAARQVRAALGDGRARGALRAVALPSLPQTDFDHLLRAADLNLVRGEDSFVRAQWAGRPFVWQIYPQQDDAHHVKLEAFLDRLRPSPDVAGFWRAWNADAGDGLPPLPRLDDWTRDAAAWRDRLLDLPDLTAGLLRAAGAWH